MQRRSAFDRLRVRYCICNLDVIDQKEMRAIEILALDYVTLPEGGLWAINYGFVLLGAIAAAFLSRRRNVMSRVPYFVYTALLFVAIVACQAVWLTVLEAKASQFLWAVVAFNAVSMVAVGWFLYLIAMARSRDIVGHKRRAVFALVPVCNLMLLLEPSRNGASPDRHLTKPFLNGAPGIVSGVVVLVAGAVLADYIWHEIDRQPELVVLGDPTEKADAIETLLEAYGLQRTLDEIAYATRTPVYVDDVITLVDVRASGTQLLRTHVVDFDGLVDDPEAALLNIYTQATVEWWICSYPPFAVLLKNGATIREIYVLPDRTRITEFIVVGARCGY